MPVSSALGRAVWAGHAPRRTDDGARVGRQQRDDYCLQQVAHQVRRRVGQGSSGHACNSTPVTTPSTACAGVSGAVTALNGGSTSDSA